MAQPKNPPMSVRLPDELLFQIDEVAERHSIKRHAAILHLVALGVAADKAGTASALAVAAPVGPKPAAAKTASKAVAADPPDTRKSRGWDRDGNPIY